MTVEELMQTLSLASFVLAGVFLLISIALFFLFDIHRVIGDISGATARKAIENIRQQNEETGDKAYKPSRVNMERGKVTDKISMSGKIHKQADPLTVATGTSELSSVEHASSVGSSESSETSVIIDCFQTELPVEQHTSAETTVLAQPIPNVFAIDYEIAFCGSTEIIE